MRLGEIVGLQAENVYEDHIKVIHSFERNYGLKDTKTHIEREVPISFTIYDQILTTLDGRTHGFVFSNDGGTTPCYHKTITKTLYKALEQIGISPEERRNRNITFHSWRHFFNTTFRSLVPDYVLQQITGHSTIQMVEHYTQKNQQQFRDFRAIQNKIFGI